jgi:hypothetical protein
VAINERAARSRRAVMLAGVAGVAAIAVETLARPAQVLANDPNDVTKGVVNHATNLTTLINDAERGTGLAVYSDLIGMVVSAGNDNGIGLKVGGDLGIEVNGELAISAEGTEQGIVASAREAIYGEGDDVGVHGSGDIAGLKGESGLGYAVLGTSSADGHPAILGWSTANVSGVQGYSAPSSRPPGPPPAAVGVYGYAAQAATARGVYGQSTVGRGVEGHATSGIGVVASATSGTALEATGGSTGWALRTTQGRVGFNTAGLASIAAGSDHVTVSPGFPISSTSKVLAILQGDPGNGALVGHVSRDVANDRFTIKLTVSAARATPIAWFVIG